MYQKTYIPIPVCRIETDFFFLPERNHVASLLLAVMVPGDRVHFQYLRHFNETAQVHALAKRHGQLPVDHRALAHASRRVGHVLQEPAQ